MNPVLFAPVSPCAPGITPNYTALLCDPEFKNVIKSLFFTLLEEDSEFKETVRGFIDCSITMSEHNILRRISTTEKILGLNDYPAFCEEEEHEPTIPEQIKELSNRIEQPLNNGSKEPNEAIPVIETIRDLKACAIVEYLQAEVKPNNFGQFVVDMKELVTFLTIKISEELRVKKVSRQLKADLFERAVKLFPDIVYIKKSPSGNKTKMLVLKTSSKCTITHVLTRTAPLGILA